MTRLVGTARAFAGKLECDFPTFQLARSTSHSRVGGNLKLENLPTGFPTFQLPLSRSQSGFRQMESWKFPFSYGAVCPGLMPGTPRPLLRIPDNNQQKEAGAWAV